jgi:hypothetical protein
MVYFQAFASNRLNPFIPPTGRFILPTGWKDHTMIRRMEHGRVSMQRIFVLTAIAALAATFSSHGAFAQGKKPHPLCNMERCLAYCSKQGGQPRLCPDFCQKRTAERKAAGQC